jgi:HNH endonuclease
MLHILIGENAARATWEDCAHRGQPIRWIVPKAAEPGDHALFLFNKDQFIGKGVVASEPEPTTFIGQPAFRADVRDLKQFSHPLAVPDVATRLPEWAWPRSYTKGKTTPKGAIPGRLLRIVSEHEARVGFTSSHGGEGSGASPSKKGQSTKPGRGMAHSDAGSRWAELFPAAEREVAARALSRSIRAAHALHSACWTVTLGHDFVRLNVGVPLALTLAPDGCQLVVMRDAQEIPKLRRLGLEREGGFAKAPGTVCVSFPLSALAEVHRRLWASHAAAMRIAVGKQGATPHTGYSHDMVAFLRSEGFDIPDSGCKGALAARHGPLDDPEPVEDFDPASLADGREYARRTILRRQGQTAFRLALLRAYDGQCAVTGCGVVEVLQAAHIVQYRGAVTDRVENGLLLRSDIHDLFDLGKLSFDDDWRVLLHDDLRGSAYRALEGKRVRMPRVKTSWPSLKALRARRGEG